MRALDQAADRSAWTWTQHIEALEDAVAAQWAGAGRMAPSRSSAADRLTVHNWTVDYIEQHDEVADALGSSVYRFVWSEIQRVR